MRKEYRVQIFNMPLTWIHASVLCRGHVREDARWVVAVWGVALALSALRTGIGQSTMAHRALAGAAVWLLADFLLSAMRIAVLDRLDRRITGDPRKKKGLLWPLRRRRVWTNWILIRIIAAILCLPAYYMGIMEDKLVQMWLALLIIGMMLVEEGRMQQTGCTASLMEALWGYLRFVGFAVIPLLFTLLFQIAGNLIRFEMLQVWDMKEAWAGWLAQALSRWPFLLGLGVWGMPRFYTFLLLFLQDVDDDETDRRWHPERYLD